VAQPRSKQAIASFSCGHGEGAGEGSKSHTLFRKGKSRFLHCILVLEDAIGEEKVVVILEILVELSGAGERRSRKEDFQMLKENLAETRARSGDALGIPLLLLP